jgi:DNA invertase Pin-like site-specific DNA recombinase
MGRLILNVLLSFAQFEREVIGERVRDKIATSKSKGLWVGGPVLLGYRSTAKKLAVVPENLCRLSAARFDLSLRDVEDLLAERGILASYETVRRWVP